MNSDTTSIAARDQLTISGFRIDRVSRTAATAASRCAVLLAVFSALLLAGTQPARAQTEKVLYSFCPPKSGCADGAYPAAGVVRDANGNLYGTTDSGGANEFGAVFEVTPDGREKVLHSFCPPNSGCSDGKYPQAGLVRDAKGNLYGTAPSGGANGFGVVFEVTPAGKEKVLYSFCPPNSGCSDGEEPAAGVVRDANGNLYGTTTYGGANGFGVVFELTPVGNEKVLYSFCPAKSGCSDGKYPAAGLVRGAKGNLYSTTYGGGANGFGAVFEVTPGGREKVLHSFCPPNSGCSDGKLTQAGLVRDAKGNLYGTTPSGGANGFGVVFEVTPAGKEKVLYSFCPPNSGCADGSGPIGGLARDGKGNLYGATLGGGTNGFGAVFEVTPDGREKVLYSFCPAKSGCSDGKYPEAGLVRDAEGNLYGTTLNGGANGFGVVFQVTP